jgi:hypothetical protein
MSTPGQRTSVSSIGWLGGIPAVNVLQEWIGGGNDRAAQASLLRQSDLYGRAVIAPAAAVTENPITDTLIGSIQLVAGQYATPADAADLPGQVYGMWASSLAQASVVSLITLLLLLFPTGRVPSPRWRPVAWSLVAGLGLVLITQALTPRALTDVPGETNPLGVPALEPILGPLEAVAGVLLIFGVVGALASLVVRLRRSRGRERQQLKWFVYVALLGILSIFPLGPLLSGLLPSDHGGILDTLLNPWLLAPTALMITVAAAIVRHQLYDIDRVINRTLGLCSAHHAARRHLRRPGPGLRPAVWRAQRRAAELGGGRRHPGRSGPVPAGPPPHPGGRGSPLQPPQVQHGPDHPGVLDPPARPGRPRYALHRAAGGRWPDHGADPGLAVASTSPTRLPGRSSQCATANSLGLLSTTAGLYL